MADTLTNIELPAKTWVNLYAESGIATGSQILIENLSGIEVKLHSSDTTPTSTDVKNDNTGAFSRVKSYEKDTSTPTGSIVWAYANSKCLVNVRDLSLEGSVKNGGVPLDVTRKLRIEGHNPSIGGGNVWNDIWEGGALIIPEPDQITGEQLQVRSSSASDTLAGVGAQRVRIDYLAGGTLSFEELDLNGSTPVLTVATNITDIIDFHSVQVGSSEVAIGNVDITEVGNISLIFNRIAVNGNKSMSTLRHLLPDSTFYITDMVLSGDTKGTEVIFRSDSSDGGVVYPGVFLFNVPITMTDAPAVIRFNPALEIPGTARMKVSARAGASGNTVSVFINGWVKI